MSEELGEQAAEAFAGITSLLAVGLITWMIFWMAKNARNIKAHLHGEMDKALAASSVAVAMVAFVAVIREGLETALFLWTGANATGDNSAAVLAAIAFNLTRAAGTIAAPDLARATTPTIRRTLITVPARVATSARRITLHLPKAWPWETAWTALFDRVSDPPSIVAT